jgi:hypothetical protein
MSFPRYVTTAYDAIERRGLTVWEFLEQEYGHDQSRHPMGDELVALEFYLDEEDPIGFLNKLQEYDNGQV